MMRFLICTVFILISLYSNSQPAKDFAAISQQVKAAVQNLVVLSSKPQLEAAAIKKINVRGASKPVYIDTSYGWTANNRDELYTWNVMLKNYPLGTPPATYTEYHNAVNNLLDSIFPGSRLPDSEPKWIKRRLPSAYTFTYLYDSKDNADYSGISLFFRIEKQVPGLLQKMKDSVKKTFYSAVDKATTRKEIEKAREAFVKALQRQNFPYPLPRQLYAEAVKEKAHNNADVAAELLLNYPFFVDKPTELINLVQPDVATEVRARAKRIVDDYNAYMEAATNPPQLTTPNNSSTTSTPVKKKTYTNVCEEEVDGLKHKPGDYVVQGHKVALVTNYDCATDKYMIAWIDRSKDKVIVELVMKDVITNSYSRGSTLNGLPFICSACNGFGYLLEAETKQMFNNPPGTLTVEYTTGKTNKVGCGTCRGLGHIKSR